jgi:hypothetical protein
MRFPLKSVSLVLNLVLVGCVLLLVLSKQTAAPPAAGPSARSPATVATPGVTDALPGKSAVSNISSAIDWATDDGASAIRELRRLGAPAHVLHAVASAILQKRDRALRAAIRDPGDIPRWRRAQPQRLSADKQAQLAEIQIKAGAELRRLLGADYDNALVDGAKIDDKYAGLSPERIAQVMQIETDYSRVRSSEAARDPASRRLLEAEMYSDLASVLSPGELADYMAYYSGFAQRLQQRLVGSNLTDEEYRRVYDQAQQFQQQFYTEPGNAQTVEQSAAYRLAELDFIRDATSAEVIAGMALQQDTEFRRVMSAIDNDSNEPPGRVVERYRDFLSFFGEMDAIQGISKSREETYRTGRSAAERVYSALTADLNPQDRSRFDETQFGKYLARSFNGPN